MQGTILNVNKGEQLILGADGRRYRFDPADWKGAHAPGTSEGVDFVITETGRAAEIYPVPTGGALARPSEGSSVLLGSLGIAFLVLGFIIPVLPLVVALVLGLVGAASARQYHNPVGLVLSRIAWIGSLLLTLIGVALVAFGLAVIWPYLASMLETLRQLTEPGITV